MTDTRAAAELLKQLGIGESIHTMQVVEHALQQAGQPLRWTKERPTKAGWYWWKGKRNIPTMVHLEVPADLDDIHAGRWVGEWAGPIAPPERGEE